MKERHMIVLPKIADDTGFLPEQLQYFDVSADIQIVVIPGWGMANIKPDLMPGANSRLTSKLSTVLGTPWVIDDLDFTFKHTTARNFCRQALNGNSYKDSVLTAFEYINWRFDYHETLKRNKFELKVLQKFLKSFIEAGIEDMLEYAWLMRITNREFILKSVNERVEILSTVWFKIAEKYNMTDWEYDLDIF